MCIKTHETHRRSMICYIRHPGADRARSEALALSRRIRHFFASRPAPETQMDFCRTHPSVILYSKQWDEQQGCLNHLQSSCYSCDCVNAVKGNTRFTPIGIKLAHQRLCQNPLIPKEDLGNEGTKRPFSRYYDSTPGFGPLTPTLSPGERGPLSAGRRHLSFDLPSSLIRRFFPAARPSPSPPG
jgi:hypothetical protein